MPMRPLPPRPCGLVRRQRRALDVAGVADRDDHVLFLDQVLQVDLLGHGYDLRPSSVPEPRLDPVQLLDDDLELQALAAEDLAAAARSASASPRTRRRSSVARARSAAEVACPGSPGACASLNWNRCCSASFASAAVLRGPDQLRPPRPGDRSRSSGLRGCAHAPRPCAGRGSCAGPRSRGGSRGTAAASASATTVVADR